MSLKIAGVKLAGDGDCIREARVRKQEQEDEGVKNGAVNSNGDL